MSTFYLSVPNFLQYKKEIIATMEQAVRYAQLAKNTNEYLSCLHDIAQVKLHFRIFKKRIGFFRHFFYLMIIKVQKIIF